MLTLLIVVCVAAAFALAFLARRTTIPPALLVLLACALPLGAFMLMQVRARPTVAPFTFRVTGQYHHLSDSLTIGSAESSDFVLTDSTAPPAAVVLTYDPSGDGITARVALSRTPVLLGGRPINAVALGRAAEITDGSGSIVRISRPWWCWYRCSARRIRTTTERDASTDTTSTLRVGNTAVVLFRAGRRDYIAADPGAGITVNGASIPSALSGKSDTLRIGYPRGVAIGITANVAQQRFELRSGNPSRSRWELEPETTADTTRFLVAATRGEDMRGTTRLINPATVAPGAAATPYGGILEHSEGSWRWTSNAVTRELRAGTEELLPGGDRRSGHLVLLEQHDTEPASGRRAAAVAWIAGALLLAWVWRGLDPVGASARIAVAGLIYTMVFIRGTLAFRAWLAPPNNTSAATTYFALLIALPAMAAACHVWQDAADDAASRVARRRQWLLAVPIVLQLAIALTAVLLSVAPAWRTTILTASLAPLAIGITGLAFLQRVLSERSKHGTTPGPLAPLEPSHVDRGTFTGFASAVAVLAVLGALIPVATRLVRGGTALALIAWCAFAGMTVLLGSMKHVFIKRRNPQRRVIPSAVLGVVTAMAVFSITRSLVAAPIAAGLMAAAGWVWFGRQGPRIRPVHLYDLLPPSFLLALLVGAAAVITLGAVRPLAVAGEYALALGGLLVFVRIFAVLWFRVAERRTRLSTGRQAAGFKPLPGVWAVFAALLLGMVIFAPLAADPGLLMLFLSAAIIAAVVGMATLGTRGGAAGALMALSLGLAFFLGMWVRPNTLTNTTKPLGTPEIRYAAVYHPEELETRMLHSRGSEPFVIVNTLQQYWGMRNYTALADTRGQGYFRTDFTNRGTKEAVALTDNAFSVFVLSEHGWMGGAAVLLCYLALALTLLNGAMHSCERRANVPRAILLVGLAAFWFVPTLYLAAANGLLVPLTGQNIPMLGLLSNADVAMASWLSALALIALPAATAAGEEHIHAGAAVQSIRRAIRAVAGVFAFGALAVIVLLWKPTHGVYDDFRLDTLVARVEELAARGAFKVIKSPAGDSIAVAQSAARMPAMASGAFLERSVRRSNEIARSGRAGGNCYEADALLRVSDEGDVIVFPSVCRIQAVTGASFPWRGHMRVQTGAPELVVSDGRTSVSISPDAPDELAVIGASCGAAGNARARSVQIGCAKDAPVLQTGTKLYVLKNGGPNVEVNGSATGPLALVSPGDRIHVLKQADVITDTVPAGALSYARWINGTWRRLTPREGSPLLAQVDTQLARGLAGREHSQLDATLTLNRHLHTLLQDRVAAACKVIPGARRCSVTLANPITGGIRALAQYPVGLTPPRDLPADANLRNHPAASAVKPLIAAGALAAYPRLRTLEVEHTQGVYTTIANTDLGAPYDAHRLYPGSRVPFSAFLPASDNVYAATLGFLAAAQPYEAGLPARAGTANASRLTLEGQPLVGRPDWKTKDGHLSLGESPLALGLEKMFGVHPVAKGAPAIDDRFWKGAVDKSYMQGTFELQRITPEPVVLRLDEIQTPRALATFMIGGGTDRWNNIAMVEGLSRIYTGRRIDMHLLHTIGVDTLELRADSLPGMADTRVPIVDGMRGVITNSYATAVSLKNEFAAAGLDWAGKTGTLKEAEWTGSIFMFVGAPKDRGVNACPAVGIVTIEFARGADPDGKATAFFKSVIAPLLRSELGWGDKRCVAR